ncbi:MAG TPA: undecaprenyldiphospho-muramoylpentapeptide beta-N-acetylglucosaminyltransferase [Actinomycetota bacterium]|jgi:UDP-N-acetylglucosamine--N-acetylmuramyl-(pentapeptide) pyrophosphoryl-undecaprenol N-acetylglucosamine transferase|nr:undecaprenyldiphospho-muramoylpentapeptide beta-N-acetylglucosaminyltransferase [Actinomycetota bacterium]
MTSADPTPTTPASGADPAPGPAGLPAVEDRPGLSLLVAAGGTGGHVFPGLALARTILQHDPRATVRFAGTTRGIETRAVPEAGFALDLLPILPLSRRLAAETLKAPFAAVNGTFAARRLLRQHRFDVVCGMGGYVTLPVAVAARLEKVPVVLHEQNAVPGIANRLAARVARRIAVGVEAAAAAFPPDRTTVVGNPVRPELARLDRAALHDEAVAAFGLDPARRTLFVFGGSQGARRINQAVIEATPHWPDPGAVQVLHACGRRDEAEVRAAWAEADPDGRGLLVKIVPFIDRMDLAYAAADLAMTRAGAITVAELTAAGMPAVMVPLPHATADHQAANARAVAAGGGAVVADDATLDGPAVVAAAAPLLADPDRLAAMAARMRAQAHPAAADELAALVVEASGRATREQFLAEVAAAATPVDREATGWFESAGTPAGGPSVQRKVARRTKRMEAYPPVDRRSPAERGSGGPVPGPEGARAEPEGAKAPPPVGGYFDPEDTPAKDPAPGDGSSNGRAPEPRGGPPTDKGAGP